MPSASRPFTDEMVTRLVLARRRGDAARAAHRRVVARRRPSARTPSGSGCPPSPPIASTRPGARAAASSPSAPPSCVPSRARSSPAGRGRSPREGWTDLVVTPERGVQVVDGLLTGWHEPEASHLLMLEAIAGRPALELAYRAAIASGLPLARVRRHPPDPPRPGGRPARPRRPAPRRTMTMQRTPSISDSRRGVIDALKQRGEADVDELADDLSMTVAGVRQHLDHAARRGPGREPRDPSRQRRTRPAQAPLHADRPQRAPVPQGLRRAGQRAAAPRGRRGRHAGRADLRAPPRLPDRQRPARLASKRTLRGQGRGAGPHPRRGRLPGRVGGDRPRPVPDHRAQLRHPRRGQPPPVGLPQRDRVPAERCCPRPPSSACRTSSPARTSAPT